MVRATLNYLAPLEEKPRTYLVDPPGGTPWRNFKTEAARVGILDGRELEEEPTLDGTGFALVHHQTEIADLYDAAGVRERYYPEMEALVKRATGAARVFAFDHNVRSSSTATTAGSRFDNDADANDRVRGSDEGEEGGLQNPVWFAHNDYTEASGPQRVRELLPEEAETLLQRRFAIVNVWKPIRGPVRDVPLAVLDARSIREDDLVASDLVFWNRVGEVYSLAFNPEHRWVYYSQMQADEALLLKGYDSDPQRARFTGHTAFDDPTSPADAPARESIEVRTLVFF